MTGCELMQELLALGMKGENLMKEVRVMNGGHFEKVTSVRPFSVIYDGSDEFFLLGAERKEKENG